MGEFEGENKDQLLKLVRYQISTSNSNVSLEDYIKQLKPGQQKIFYSSNITRQNIGNSPYLEPFIRSNTPVLLLNN